MQTAHNKPIINRFIDHTLLRPEATKQQIEKLCQEARDHQFFSVCVNPYNVSLSAQLLKNSHSIVCTVIGFPLGANCTETKVFETKKAIYDGAMEIDMVTNIGAVKNKEWNFIEDEISAIVIAAEKKIVKVIFETSLLSDEEKIKLCEIASRAGAHFVKTSTGFSTGGATIEDVILMKKNISAHMEVKASGGVRDIKTAQELLFAGATRLGTSSGVLLVQGMKAIDGQY